MNNSERDKTLEYYETNTVEFYESTVIADLTILHDKFLEQVPVGGRILDFGCGSGRDTKAFLDRGYQVDAIDGSAELSKLASQYTGIQVRCMDFFDLDAINTYDGIWACASLLHVEKQRIPDIISKLRDALVTGGVLYMSFKYGDFNEFRDERHFTDLNEELAEELLSKINGIETVDIWQSYDVRRGKDVHWLNVMVRKV